MSYQIIIRTENRDNIFARHSNGEITYHINNKITDKEFTVYKFDANSLT